MKPPLSSISHRDASQGQRGFTLIETLLGCLLFSLLLGTLLAGSLTLQRALFPQRQRVGGLVLPVAPAYAAYPAALRVQERLITHLEGAVATYVLGGGHAGLAETPVEILTRPLAGDALPQIADFAAGLPQDSATFQKTYAEALGAGLESAGTQDFSLLVVGTRSGALAVTCLLQCRSRLVRPDGEARLWRRFDVGLRDAEGEVLGYSFLVRPESVDTAGAGVMHTWHRLDVAAGVQEEGPACLVLPDPWRFGGDGSGSAAESPFSRFTYFLPIGA